MRAIRQPSSPPVRPVFPHRLLLPHSGATIAFESLQKPGTCYMRQFATYIYRMPNATIYPWVRSDRAATPWLMVPAIVDNGRPCRTPIQSSFVVCIS